MAEAVGLWVWRGRQSRRGEEGPRPCRYSPLLSSVSRFPVSFHGKDGGRSDFFAVLPREFWGITPGSSSDVGSHTSVGEAWLLQGAFAWSRGQFTYPTLLGDGSQRSDGGMDRD